jgi:integrase
MLFRVYSRYVPNLTRQDGSAMERLLASSFAPGLASGDGGLSNSSSG